MIRKLKTVSAPPGTFIKRRSRDGQMRLRVCHRWIVWGLYNRQGELLQLLSEPCSTDARKRPESLQEGFTGFIYPSLPADLFL